MSARADHFRAKLRGVSISSVLLYGMPHALPAAPQPVAVPEPEEYVDARTEARQLCRNLGLDVDNEHWDGASVGDFIRLAYAQGWKACESRIISPDVGDAIALALRTPTAILGGDSGLGMPTMVVRAVQRAVAYGVPK